VDPTVVVTLGNFSSKLLLGTGVGITKLRGQAYRFGDPERHLVPTFHPAAALRGGADVLARMRDDLRRAGVLVAAR
jgi:DNA polymerase